MGHSPIRVDEEAKERRANSKQLRFLSDDENHHIVSISFSCLSLFSHIDMKKISLDVYELFGFAK